MFTNSLPNVHQHNRTNETSVHVRSFNYLTNRTKFLVHVRSFIKRTNINELPAERFTNCLLNVWFVYSPTSNKCLMVYPKVDVISKLPSGITIAILCLLPIQEAARTSNLSKEWRYH
ncbi:putative F-box-like domain superfamily protein [Helianthus anomalus]